MPIGRTLLSPATLRQRILGSRRWTILSLAALTALFTVPWMMFSGRNEWPAKVTLRAPGGAWPLAFSLDSRTFATSNVDGITLWDVDNGRKRATWGVAGAQVGAFSPDGQIVAVALSNYPDPTTIALIDVDTGRMNFSWSTQYTCVFDLAFLENGTRASVRCWELPLNRRSSRPGMPRRDRKHQGADSRARQTRATRRSHPMAGCWPWPRTGERPSGFGILTWTANWGG